MIRSRRSSATWTVKCDLPAMAALSFSRVLPCACRRRVNLSTGALGPLPDSARMACLRCQAVVAHTARRGCLSKHGDGGLAVSGRHQPGPPIALRHRRKHLASSAHDDLSRHRCHRPNSVAHCRSSARFCLVTFLLRQCVGNFSKPIDTQTPVLAVPLDTVRGISWGICPRLAQRRAAGAAPTSKHLRLRGA